MPREGTSLVPITVRFSQNAYDAISDIADNHNMSKADLVRRCVTGNLAEYLGSVKILDGDQVIEIRAAIRDLFDKASQVKDELNRIGANYNEEIHLMNREGRHIGSGSALPADAVNDAIARFEAAAREAGELLCRFLA